MEELGTKSSVLNTSVPFRNVENHKKCVFQRLENALGAPETPKNGVLKSMNIRFRSLHVAFLPLPWCPRCPQDAKMVPKYCQKDA